MSTKTEKRVAGTWEYRLQAFKALASFTPKMDRLTGTKPASGTTISFRKQGVYTDSGGPGRWQKLNVYDRKPEDEALSVPENIIAIIEGYLAQKVAGRVD